MRGRKPAAVTSEGRRFSGAACDSVPEPPSWLSERAKEVFAEVAGQLQAIGALAVTDCGTLARYASAFAKMVAAEEAMTKSGEEIFYHQLVNRSGAPASSVPTPPMAMYLAMSREVSRLSVSLGLTPVDRQKLPGAGPIDPSDGMAELLLMRDARSQRATA